ncbi:MAG TPA: hypothetical protein VNT30_17710 [Stellaceae bacterium]|nr:hypothetical protein [Stellaceae bacterium]
MTIAFLFIFLLCLFGLVASLVLAKPIERLLTERSGISEQSEQIAAARTALVAAQAERTQLERQVSVLDARLSDVERRSQVLKQRLNQMVAPEWDLIFELGIVEPGYEPFEYNVARPNVLANQLGIRPAEDALYAAPRRVHCWARTEQAASALVVGRFPSHDGFVIYPADRPQSNALAIAQAQHKAEHDAAAAHA